MFAKYYTAPHPDPASPTLSTTTTVKEQKTFEKGLFNKTNKQNADVIIYDNHVVVYKQVADVILYIVARSLNENEAMLYQVIVGLRDALDILLAHNIDKRTILENFDLIALAIDETIDSGIILEVDPVVIAARTSKAPTSEPTFNNIELNEQGVSQNTLFLKFSNRNSFTTYCNSLEASYLKNSASSSNILHTIVTIFNDFQSSLFLLSSFGLTFGSALGAFGSSL